jgi:antitoxin PrlF
MNGMSLAKSRLTAQGQISVPAEVRRKLGVGPGSVLEWEQVGGQMLVRRAGTFSSQDVHRALFAKVPAKRSLEDLKRGRTEHVRKRHARG